MTVQALILRAPGINRDADAAAACELAGAVAERVHVNRLAEGSLQLRDYGLLVVPGGFSYGDHLGAGKLLAVDLIHRLGDQLAAFVADGRPVLGICNGFQVLVKAGVLPGTSPHASDSDACHTPSVTLTDNASERFECRWVRLAADPASRCIFTRGIEQPIETPVAHGEGRLVVRDAATLEQLRAAGQIALRYVDANSTASYPANPNGSMDDIAGLCNAQGNVLGLMPHPENAILPQQHPRWTREPWRHTGDGLAIFRNAVCYAANL
ncbi:MAG: phosphoribosylformylglycinamidine synthase I [Chloroflexales bacterium]|nr:phosphoribosylformylglycinamidine synthase I [Chloroflexales bacterium]